MNAITNAEFLEAMFLDLHDDSVAMVCGFAGDPRPPVATDDDRKRWFARPWMFGKQPARCGAMTNNYLAVSSFRADPQTGDYRRRKANFARLHAVMLDDLGDGPGAKLPMSRMDRLSPSALVETSPRNYQAWYFLEPSAETDDRETAERLIARMIAQGLCADTDPGMSGVTRYGRLPVGINGKAKYLQDGRPFRVRLELWKPGRRYHVATVVHFFGLDLTPPPVQPRRAVTLEEAHRGVDDFDALLLVIQAAGMYLKPLGEGRHAIRCPWIESHTQRDDDGAALLEPSEKNSWLGGYKCWHGHCEKTRRIGDVYRFARSLLRAAA